MNAHLRVLNTISFVNDAFICAHALVQLLETIAFSTSASMKSGSTLEALGRLCVSIADFWAQATVLKAAPSVHALLTCHFGHLRQSQGLS